MLSESTLLVRPSTSIDDTAENGSNNLQSTLLKTSANVTRRLAVITVANEDILSGYDSANVGDTLELVYGTDFAPTSSTGSSSSAIEILKAVTIRCTDIVNRCKWNGLDARRVVYIETGTQVTTTLIGLNITRAAGNGIFISESIVTMSLMTVSGNSAIANDGGGLLTMFSIVTMSLMTVSGNSVSGSGGGMKFEYSTVTMSLMTVSGNAAGSDGGGIYITCSNVTMTSMTVSGNSAAA